MSNEEDDKINLIRDDYLMMDSHTRNNSSNNDLQFRLDTPLDVCIYYLMESILFKCIF